MKTKALLVSAAVALMLGAAASFASPYWALHQMKSASETSDAQKLNRYVDYPALRESLKLQARAAINKEIGTATALANAANGGDSAAAVGAALGAGFMNVVVDQLVESLVTPEAIVEMMKNGGLKAASNEGDSVTARDEVDVSLAYRSWGEVVVTVAKPNSEDERVGMRLQRAGLFSWKLSGIELPL